MTPRTTGDGHPIQTELPLDIPPLSDADRAYLAARTVPGWEQQARCAAAADDTWFPDDPAGEQAAIRACAGCSVRTSCLFTALVDDEQGVWGGTTETDRDWIRVDLHLRQAAA
jgi:hypothetical protein